MSVTKRIRIFTAEDVAEHDSFKSCWVTRNGKVYDVTSFLSDHPGGDDLIIKYAGQDIGEVMEDPREHEHSDSAYDMLDEFLVGRVGTDAGLIDEGPLSLLLPCIFLIGCQTGFPMSTFTLMIRTLPRILLKMNSLT
jgi:cytochrome b involved in lipid metabolism